MVTRRPPRTLPGSEPLMVNKVLLGIFLGMVVVILALSMATAAALGAHAQGGQLGVTSWRSVLNSRGLPDIAQCHVAKGGRWSSRVSNRKRLALLGVSSLAILSIGSG